MTANMNSTERNERFRQLYNADMTTLDAQSTTVQLVTIVDDLVLSNDGPKAAAEQAASLVLSEVEPERPYTQLLAIPHHAALVVADESALQKLVDFMTALANLPTAVNESSEPKTATTYHPEVKSGILTFQPGEAIVFENGALWKDLPNWSMMITETHQGPEQWLVKYRGQDDEATATQKWKNFNTYLALFVASPEARATPALSHLSWLGLKTLAIICESPADAWNYHEELWLPAGQQWMRVAGDELAKVCAGGEQKFPPGDLWKAEGGGKICDSKRFEFWTKRLDQKAKRVCFASGGIYRPHRGRHWRR